MTRIRSRIRLGAAGLACLGLVALAGRSPVARSEPGLPELLAATLAGEELLVLRFAGPVQPDALELERDLRLVARGDRWGEDARVAREQPSADAVSVRLGRGATLSLYNTYLPGLPGPSPAQVALPGRAPVPILPEPSALRSYVGYRYADSPGLRPFYGQLHTHTGDSDGRGAPPEAYAVARANGLDFFSVTDHLEYLGDERWPAQAVAAEAATEDGRFVAIRGFEWSGNRKRGRLDVWFNHMNMIGSADRPADPRMRSINPLHDIPLSTVYANFIALQGDPVGIFNHPHRTRYFGVFRVDNWDGFAFSAEANLRVRLIHVAPGNRAQERIGYVRALDQGWRLAPESNQDGHDRQWGTDGRRTGVWAEALTREGILGGLRSLRTFATNDPGVSVKLLADGRWLMGSTLPGPGAHRLALSVSHRDPARSVARVEWITRGGETVGAGERDLELEVDPELDTYYYARVTLDNGRVAVTAPIFIDR